MHQQRKASSSFQERPSYTSSSRPHTLVAQALIHQQLKAAYSSSLRPHILVAQSLRHQYLKASCTDMIYQLLTCFTSCLTDGRRWRNDSKQTHELSPGGPRQCVCVCVCVCVCSWWMREGGCWGKIFVQLDNSNAFHFDDLCLLSLIFACEYADSSRLTHEENVAIIDELVRDILGREQFL